MTTTETPSPKPKTKTATFDVPVDLLERFSATCAATGRKKAWAVTYGLEAAIAHMLGQSIEPAPGPGPVVAAVPGHVPAAVVAGGQPDDPFNRLRAGIRKAPAPPPPIPEPNDGLTPDTHWGALDSSIRLERIWSLPPGPLQDLGEPLELANGSLCTLSRYPTRQTAPGERKVDISAPQPARPMFIVSLRLDVGLFPPRLVELLGEDLAGAFQGFHAIAAASTVWFPLNAILAVFKADRRVVIDSHDPAVDCITIAGVEYIDQAALATAYDMRKEPSYELISLFETQIQLMRETVLEAREQYGIKG